MFAVRHRISVTTASDGSATVYSPAGISGRIHAIAYSKVDFADGVDFTITLEATGESLWTDTNINASETVYPVAKANLGTTGAASTITEVPVMAANDRVKFVIAQGGNAKSGVFWLIVT